MGVGFFVMEIEIRCCCEGDVAVLQDISRRTIRADYVSFLGETAVEGFVGSGAADDYVAGCVDGCWVIVVDGQVAGYCVCKGDLIDLMMIGHEYHRRGLGSRLLEHCEGMLFESYDEIRLESFEGNVKANGFYEKNGWVGGRVYFDDEAGVNKIEFGKSV